MHIISKKDLNSPEIDTLTKSCCPTIVINSQWRSADAWRGHSLCQRIEYILDNESPRRYASSFIAQKALAMKTDTLTSGSTVKNHISFKKGIRIQCNTENFVPIVVPGLSTSSSSSSHPSTSMAPSRQESHHPTSSSSSSSSPTTTVSSDSEIRDRGSKWNWFPSSACVKFKCWRDDRTAKPVVYCRFRYKPPSQPKSKNKCRGNHDRTGKPVVCRLRSSTVEFWNLGVAARIHRKSFSDERVPEHRDSHASSSHGVSSEPASKRSVDLGNHSAYTHFPKDRNCEICQRTKITRAPCRRRNGGAVLRAENFGDLITSYHKVLSENCDSRNNHRYAVVVQDLATQWIQSYPCKTKTSRETHKGACKSSWSRIGSLKSFTDNQFLGIWQSLWRSFLESLYVDTTQIRNKRNCWESSAQSKRRDICCTVAIRSGQWMVGSFHGMLHLSAKRHRSLIWWEDALWKTFWATF